MAGQEARSVDTNSNVGPSSNPSINIGTSTNTNMAMVTQPLQEQGVPYGYGSNNAYVSEYGYDGYQYAYPGQYPQHPSEYAGGPQYPHVLPPSINVLVNINQNGQNNNYYGHPGAYQFQAATPQPQLHSYHQEQQLQPQPQRFEMMQEQTSQTGTVIFQDEYNLPGFITRYANAKFFVIKCYNKEYVLSSIRHGVWTSTYRGNRKLNAAYSEAASGEQRVQGATSTASSNCPIFLLFSVNRSGNFCGVAEMVGPVDFGAKTEFWEWKDKFPVKWHMIKDVPFSQILHITLESNENRSITFSRDTQQVEKEKGEEILDIFKNYVWRTSLLDEIALPRRRRVEVVIRRPPSPPHNHDQEQQGQQRQQLEEEAATTNSCRSWSNDQNRQEEETDQNNARESEGGESQETKSTVIHCTNNKNKTEEEETDHNNAREYECQENRETKSNNKIQENTDNNKQEEGTDQNNARETECGENHSSSNSKRMQEEGTDHNNAPEFECGENQETESTVIIVISHSQKKQEEETDTKRQQEDETDHNNGKESDCLENQETESTGISVTIHSPSNNNKKQEEETDSNKQKEEETEHNNLRESECGENQETENTVIIVTNHNASNNNKKQEEETNISVGDSMHEESHEIQSPVITVGVHSK